MSAANDCVSVKRHDGDCFSVVFRVGNQSFPVGPQDWECKAEAEWYASMFRKALAAMNEAAP